MFFVNAFSRIFAITLVLMSLCTLSDTNPQYAYGYDLEDDDSELIIPRFMFDPEPETGREEAVPAAASESGSSEVNPELEIQPEILPEAPTTMFTWNKMTQPLHSSNPSPFSLYRAHIEKPKNLTEILSKDLTKTEPLNPAMHSPTTFTEIPEPTISEYTSPPEKTSFLSNSWRIFIGFIKSLWTSISSLLL